jgi:hypothetical protein
MWKNKDYCILDLIWPCKTKCSQLRVSSTGPIFRWIKAWPAISKIFDIPDNGPNRQKIGQALIRRKIGPVEDPL